jgi:putative tributyrin esterase
MIPIEPTHPVRSIAVSDRQWECDGVRFLTLYSPSLGGRGDVSVYVPDDIEMHSAVPVVLLLHGVHDSHWAWFFKGGAHKTAANLIAASRIRPMLIVAPSDGLYQDGSAYLCHSGKDYERWITDDVMEGVARTFPCSRNAPVFLAGLSMGGYGALRMGSKRADLFRGISAHSAITRLEEMSEFVIDPFPKDGVDAAETDLLTWVEENRAILPPLRFDCGTEDPLIEGNRRFHDELKQRSISHQYEEFDGGHNWAYWQEHVSSSLLFFESILRGCSETLQAALV